MPSDAVRLTPAEAWIRGMMSPGDPAARPSAPLASMDWDVVADRLRKHRLLPMAAHLLRRSPEIADSVPAVLLAEASDAHRAATLDAMGKMQLLVDLSGAFATAQIEHCALKGVDLAFHAYPEIGLRPMRDMDILVRGNDAIKRAYAMLIERGFTPYHDNVGDPFAMLAHSHQLPLLLSPDGTQAVELHQRMLHAAGRDPSHDPQFWDSVRSVELLDTRVPVPSLADQRLHLALHAARSNRFDNGPLTVSDFAYLNRQGSPDPNRLSTLIDRYGAGRDIALLDALSRQAFDGMVADDALAPGIELAWSLMVADPDRVRASKIRQSIGAAPAAQLRRRLWPERSRLATQWGEIGGPVDHLRALLAHWSSLATGRIVGFARRTGGKDERARLLALNEWEKRTGNQSPLE